MNFISGVCTFLLVAGELFFMLAFHRKKQLAVESGAGYEDVKRSMKRATIIGTVCITASLILLGVFSSIGKASSGIFLLFIGVMLLILASSRKKQLASQSGTGYKTVKRSMKISAIIGTVCIVAGLFIVLLFINLGRAGSGDREMGRYWICGEKGSYELDGSYYCFKHYNERMFGKLG